MTADMHQDELRSLIDELENFQEIARYLKPSPGDVPELDGIDIDGVNLPLKRTVGGDHLIYLDFKKRYDLDARIEQAMSQGRPDVAYHLRRNKRRAGIVLADVAGHRITDAMVAAMLHQAFLLGSYYELELAGEITTRLLENIQTRFYESTSINKYIALIYGEIDDQGRFRYISAGHLPPSVYSREYGRLVSLDPNRRVTGTPIGILPSSAVPDSRRYKGQERFAEQYTVNELQLLAPGDMLILHSDGLTDHADGAFYPRELELCLKENGDRPAREICAALTERVLAFGPAEDDISFVVIKRT